MLNLIITFALLAAAAYVGFLFVRAYTTTTGSWWQRTLSAGKSSATIVWAQLLIMSTGFINAFADIMSQVDPSRPTRSNPSCSRSMSRRSPC